MALRQFLGDKDAGIILLLGTTVMWLMAAQTRVSVNLDTTIFYTYSLHHLFEMPALFLLGMLCYVFAAKYGVEKEMTVLIWLPLPTFLLLRVLQGFEPAIMIVALALVVWPLYLGFYFKPIMGAIKK